MWKNILTAIYRNSNTIWALIIVTFLILFASLKMNTNDFWWLLALGRNFWETGQISNYDFLSYSVPGGFFWNHSRLFDVIIYWLYENGRYLSLQIFMFAITAAAYWFFYKTMSLKKQYWPISLLVTLLTIILLSTRILYRPELMSLLFTPLFLFILYSYKYKNSKIIWLLPILQLLWVNSHAGFIYGIALIGVFLGSEFIRLATEHKNRIILAFKNKRFLILLTVFILSTLASFLNSYGFQIISIVTSLFANDEAKYQIQEWKPYTWENLLNLANPLSLLTIGATLVIIYKIYLLPKPRKIKYFPWEDIFLYILYLYSLLSHVRFSHLTSLIMALIIAKNAVAVLPKKYALHWWPHALLLIFSLVLLFRLENREIGLGPISNHEPEQAVKFIINQQIPGNLINEYAEGGYLAFHLYPYKQIFIDGRTPNLYDNDFFWRYDQLDNANIRQWIIDKYNVNFWLWPRQNRLTDLLWDDPLWTPIYFDDISVIFIKDTPDNQELINKFGYKFFQPQADQDSIKKICEENKDNKEVNLKEKFIEELNRGLEHSPQNWLLMRNLALVYQLCDYQEGDFPKIKEYINEARKINPTDVNLLYLQGHIHLQEKNYKSAITFFKASGEQAPSLIGLATAHYNLGEYKKALNNLIKVRNSGEKITDPKFYQTLGRVYYSLDDDKKAIEFYHRYQDLTLDYSAESQTDLAQAYYYDGQLDKAQEYLSKALEKDPQYPLALELQQIMNN